MKKKIILLLLLFIIIGIGLGIYLKKTVILDKIKAEALKKIESEIGRSISIGKIEYRILKGFVISDLKISESAGHEHTDFIKVKEISANPVLFPFILQKKIMIPSINIDSLTANVTRLDENTWNFSDLLKSVTPREKTEVKFSVSVLQVRIRNSEIIFQDNALTTPLPKRLNNLNLILKPSLPKSLKFNLTTNIDNSDSKIALNGKADLQTREIESSLDISDLLITDYLVYFDKLPLKINSGILSAELKGSFKDSRLHLEGTNSFKELDIEKNEIQIMTDLTSQLTLSYDAKNTEKPFDYKATIDLSDGKISGLKFVNEVRNLNGKLDVSPDKLNSKDLQGDIFGNPFKISGSFENFKNPYLNLNLDSEASLATLKEIFKDKIDLSKIEIDGDSQFKLNIKGQTSETMDIQGSVKLSNTRLNANYLPGELNNLQANINFDKNNFSWKNLTADFRGDKLTSSGSLKDFSNPQVKLNISSNLINFVSELTTRDKILQIAKLSGDFKDSKFNIKGTADISESGNPLLNLQTDINIKLEDLAELSPKLRDIVDKMKLAGNLSAQADLNGKLKDYQNWRLGLKGNLPLLSIYGLNISDVNLDYGQGDSSLGILQLTGTPYMGRFLLKSQIDFSESDNSFVSQITINDVDISLLKNDTGLKNKDISGLLQAQIDLNGSGKNIKESLTGAGNLRIDNGNLWELELFKGLGELLLIPEFRKIVFKDASGDFLIQNQRILTDNFILESDPMNVLFEGNLDFSGNIDFTVTAQLSEGLMKDATDLQGLFNTILAQSTNAVVIKLTGTLKKPKNKIIPVPVNIFKKTKKLFIDDLIEDLVK